MIRTLIGVRLRAMLAGMLAQSRQKKKSNKGMAILLAVVFVYLGIVVAGMMCLIFSQLAPVYHQMGLDWLYFAVAGLMALLLSVFGGVFTTQSQLYDARDNELLLSMPIKPGIILLSRMVPLLGMNLLLCALVMVPAAVMYGIFAEFSLGKFLLQMAALVGICFLSQAVSCLLGWGMHLLLARMNKSLASLLYMVVFLAVYFSVYSRAGNILNAMAAEGAAIGASVRNWLWPIYAMGRGCTGEILYFTAFLAVCAGTFGVIYWVLSKTFLHSATSRRSGKKRALDMAGIKTGDAQQAMLRKEWLHFLGSPVYLTNLGLGILLTAVLAAAGVILRGKLLELAAEYGLQGLLEYVPLVICGLLAVLNSMMFLSAPSVSLEGKNLWILKSMPVPAEKILTAKLQYHCLLTTPVTAAAGLLLSIAYGCNMFEILLCALVPGLLTVLCGLVGMVFGLLWARLDWLSEAYPVKQGLAAGITMLTMMALPVVLGACYLLTGMQAELFLALCTLLIGAGCAGLYRLLMTWGVNKWNRL